MSAIRNDDECHQKQTFYIPPITQSMDTFTVGRELLSLSYVMGGIEKSCLLHKYSFPIERTARRSCKKSATFSITLVICGLEKFCCSIHHHFLHSDHSRTKNKKKKKKKNKSKIIKKWRQRFPLTWNFFGERWS